MVIRIVKIKARRAFIPTKLSGADYVINQYVGCQHACRYCYAKFMNRFYPYGEWGDWVVVKENMPDLVKAERPSGRVYMSSVSDPYQPIEKDILLTRRILENMDKGIKLSIFTKSDLILRDLDILKEFENIEMGLTINDLPREMEPFAPPHKRRIEALRKLKGKGLTTYAFISPIIPGLVDVRKLIDETKDFVDVYWLEFLNLKASGRTFVQLLKGNYPESYEVLTDEEKFKRYFRGVLETIRRLDIRVRGVCVHYPKKECVILDS